MNTVLLIVTLTAPLLTIQPAAPIQDAGYCNDLREVHRWYTDHAFRRSGQITRSAKRFLSAATKNYPSSVNEGIADGIGYFKTEDVKDLPGDPETVLLHQLVVWSLLLQYYESEEQFDALWEAAKKANLTLVNEIVTRPCQQ